MRISTAAARHPVAVLLVWLVVVLAGFTGGPAFFNHLSTTVGTAPGSQTEIGAARLHDAGLDAPVLTGVVSGRATDDPALVSSVRDALTEVRAVGGVTAVDDSFAPDAPKSTSGNALLINVVLKSGTSDETENLVADRLRQIKAPSVVVSGDALTDDEFADQADQDLRTAELIAAPVLLVLLLLVFGALLAASLPLLVAAIGVACTFSVLFVISRFTDVAVSAIQVTTMLSIGLAVDYSLLFVQRFREERARQEDLDQALAVTIVTAGRAIVFSGLTVSVSLLGLLAFTDPFLRSMGVAAASVVATDMLAAVTVLPALLALFGHRIKPAKRTARQGRIFAAWGRKVQRAPILVLVLAAGALVFLSLPAFGLHTLVHDPNSLPAGTQTRQLVDRLNVEFPSQSGPDPIAVVVSVPSSDPRLATLTQQISRIKGIAGAAPGASADGVTVVSAYLSQATDNPLSGAAVRAIRALRPPFPLVTTGDASRLVDYHAATAQRAPWAIGGVLLSIVVLLFAFTGSLVLPVKAVLSNLLSLGAALGIVVTVFQNGTGAGLLGEHKLGGIDLVVPVVMTAIAFGLSMDYEVFLVSRIREHWLATGNPDQAVVEGLRHTGRIITAAALLLAVTFAAFLSAGFVPIKEIGLGLLLAVVIDATVVRMVLVPATMTLLGRAVWWAPSPLRPPRSSASGRMR